MVGKVNKASEAFIRRKGDTDKAFRDVGQRLNKILSQIEDLTEEGLLDIAEQIKAEALPLTPIDTGALRNSAFTDSEKTATGARARVGFEADHAVFVHERRDLHHAPPTQAGFLLEASNRVRNRIAQALVDKLKKGTGL